MGTDKTGKGTDKTEKMLGETAFGQDLEKTARSSLKGFLVMECPSQTIFRHFRIATVCPGLDGQFWGMSARRGKIADENCDGEYGNALLQ